MNTRQPGGTWYLLGVPSLGDRSGILNVDLLEFEGLSIIEVPAFDKFEP